MPTSTVTDTIEVIERLNIEVFPVCEFGGNTVDVASTYSAFSVYREIVGVADSLAPVRGLVDITGTIGSVIDFEIPIDKSIKYYLLEGATAPVTFTNRLHQSSVTVAPLVNGCSETQYLRDLFSPTVDITSDFCLGAIEAQAFEVRAGIFPVIGRRAPVVVVDQASTAKGTLRFISRDAAELAHLSDSFRSPDPMLLQTIDFDLGGVGRLYGQLYFQPLNINERWMVDGRLKTHVFEVEYVEIDPPPLTSLYQRDLATYDEVNAAFDNWDEITISDMTFANLLYEV